MTEDEKRMFGMSREEIREDYMESLTAKYSGLEMVIAGILSDCQELMSYQYAADVNKTAAAASVGKKLNVAKFILFEMMDKRREEEFMLVSSDGKEIA